MGSKPNKSIPQALEASGVGLSLNTISGSPSRSPGPNTTERTAALKDTTTAANSGGAEAPVRRDQVPPAPNPFGLFKRFLRKSEVSKSKGYFSGSEASASEAEPGTEPALAVMLAARPSVLVEELEFSLRAADDEVQFQERSARAAKALLSSTEPVIDGLEEAAKADAFFLEQLKNVANNVQQVYVLAEMTDAVEAAEANLRRVEKMSANVMELAAELRNYTATANVRCLTTSNEHDKSPLLS